MKLDDLPIQFGIGAISSDPQRLIAAIQESLQGALHYRYTTPVQGRSSGYLFSITEPACDKTELLVVGQEDAGHIVKRLMEIAPYAEMFPPEWEGRKRGWNIFTYTLPDGTPAAGAFATWIP